MSDTTTPLEPTCAVLLRDSSGRPQGDDSAFRTLLGIAPDADLDAALDALTGPAAEPIGTGTAANVVAGSGVGAGPEDMIRIARPDGNCLLLSIQPVPGGELLLLQDGDRLLGYVDPIEERRDLLTGLYGRGAFEPRLRRAIGEGEHEIALHLVDLDKFKTINDTLGHGIGDRLLASVADRLTNLTRAKDVVARMGGDEFAIIQLDPDSPGGPDGLASRIVEMVGRPYVIEGHMIDIGASIGVATRHPAPVDAEASARAADELLRNADLALYRAKDAGRGCHRFFEQGMDAALRERRTLEAELRQALVFRQFELAYQPQLRLSDKRLSGVEALLRWNHPTRGQLPPGSFIALAEETGIIVPIGEWVLRQACADAAQWGDDVAVAVNVSARQLSSPRLVETVDAALERSGLPPARLEIEITENVLMADKKGCLAILHKLRERGIRISMDDFGTGYSSLSYLQSFPFDKLKIDRSFVSGGGGAKDNEIVAAISALGRVLGMETIAEGVETEGQLLSVGDVGCDTAQGFLIGTPSNAASIARLLANRILKDNELQQDRGDSEEGLYRLVYYSRNAMFAYESDLNGAIARLLEVSRRNNAAVDVGGALLFNDGWFAQVLEGPREAVETVFERIQRDDRHCEVTLIAFDPCDRRRFGEWSMAYVGARDHGASLEPEAGAFDPARFEGDGLIDHLSTLLIEEQSYAKKAA